MRDPNLIVLQPGAWFQGRYRVVRCINAGGMGAVYEVMDAKTESPRALKVILPNLVGDAEVRSRFALEARVTGSIQSEHLVRITDAGLDEATAMPFLVMDLLEGRDLGELVEQRGALPPEEVALYLSQAALALDKTHAAGIIHRDLKPENLFVIRRDDGSPCVKILDFGIAKVVADSSRAQQTRPMGTPLYMSPEQIMGAGAITPRADVYSLGHIAYTLLTGEPFWSEEAGDNGTLYALLSKIMMGTREAPGARAERRRSVRLPPGFDAWFGRVTAPTPDERFERATTAVAALAEALGVSVARPLSIASPVPAAVVGGTLPSAGVSRSAPLPGPATALATPGPQRSQGDTGTRARSPGRAALAIAAVTLALGAAAVAAFALGSRPPAPSAEPPPPSMALGGSARPPPRPEPPPEIVPGALASAVPDVSASAPATATTTAPGRPPAARPRGTAAPQRPGHPLKDEGIY